MSAGKQAKARLAVMISILLAVFVILQTTPASCLQYAQGRT
ncbi:MAG: hypothetical protein PUH70_02145 [Clostridiales bacterium]|nr:hypothetical protein [Clostridiales bacterium]MDY5514225.1 hypothetical protein [Candidatus Ventricola sp.]